MNKNELMLPSDRVILKVDLVVSPWAVLPDLPEKKKIVVCVWPASQNPYSVYDQKLWFYLVPYLWPDQKLDALFMTIVADTVALNILFEGLLFMVLSIMMTKHVEKYCK